MLKKISINNWTKSVNIRYLYAIIGFILIVAISVPLAEKLSKRYKINKEIQDLEKEIALMESRNNDFSGLISYLESDQFINEQARIKLNYKQPGEDVVIIKNNTAASTTDSTDSINYLTIEDSKPELNNNFFKWFDYFFKS